MMSCGRKWAQVLDYGGSGQNTRAHSPQTDHSKLHVALLPPIHCCRRHQCAYPRKLAQSRQTSLEQVLSQFALPPSNRPVQAGSTTLARVTNRDGRPIWSTTPSDWGGPGMDRPLLRLEASCPGFASVPSIIVLCPRLAAVKPDATLAL